jgi:hypothetical protein
MLKSSPEIAAHMKSAASGIVTTPPGSVNNAAIGFLDIRNVMGSDVRPAEEKGLKADPSTTTAAVSEAAAVPAPNAELAEEAPKAADNTHTSIQQSGLDICQTRNYLLYLGMNIPGGGTVGGVEFEAFLGREVHPRVDGFTMWSGTGFWRGEAEATTIIEVIGDGRRLPDAVAAIAAAYKQAFRQEAVLVKQNMCPAVVFL